MEKVAEILILLLQLTGAALICLGLFMVWRPLALLFAGGCACWVGHRLWQELEKKNEEDGYR